MNFLKKKDPEPVADTRSDFELTQAFRASRMEAQRLYRLLIDRGISIHFESPDKLFCKDEEVSIKRYHYLPTEVF